MLMNRIMGVFRLDAATFEEIEADQNATGQAALVVLIVALIGAIGSIIGSLIGGTSVALPALSAVVSVFVGWIVWSFVTWLVGTTIFGGKADIPEMLRVIGFAYAPQVLSIIPCIGWLIGLIWSLIAGFIAVRQGLDLDNTKALLTIVVGFIAYLIVGFLLSLIFGVAYAGLGTLTGMFS
jgi:hypothetical protein